MEDGSLSIMQNIAPFETKRSEELTKQNMREIAVDKNVDKMDKRVHLWSLVDIMQRQRQRQRQ